jgi:hypothetical protein
MSKKSVPATADDERAMTSDEASAAIQRATEKSPQMQMLRDKLIKAIEASDGGMEALVRVIRSKLHEG